MSADSVRSELEDLTGTTAGMEAYLDRHIGPGNWIYDREADVWIVPDLSHEGPGRRYALLERGGFYDVMIVPDEVFA